jgi:hypothetical protein
VHRERHNTSRRGLDCVDQVAAALRPNGRVGTGEQESSTLPIVGRARTLGVEAQTVDVRGPADIDPAFAIDAQRPPNSRSPIIRCFLNSRGER